MSCAICQVRREKRECPGVGGAICALCCGEQREQTVDCPLTCEYLQLAHEHESIEKDPNSVPNRNHQIPEEFLDSNVEFIMSLQQAILMAAYQRNAIDNDAAEALDGVVRTYQTISAGLVYESRPANPIAAAIFDGIQKRIADIRGIENEKGIHKLTDGRVLTILIFLQQLEYALNNGRKKGRSFLSAIYSSLTQAGAALDEATEPPSSLIVS